MTEAAINRPEISPTLRDPMGLFDVSGKNAIVTGASGAFGRAVSIALGALGCRLVLASGSQKGLESVSAGVREVNGECRAVVRRPNSLDDAQSIVQAAVAAYGPPDMLIIASGLNLPSPIGDMAEEDWQAVMEANVRGPWLMAKAFGQAVGERGRGKKVLFMSSVRGRHGNASGYSAYCPSKGSVDALTRVLATEWGSRGINVNAIAPTVFRSSLTSWIFEDSERGRAARARNITRIPLGRLGEPEDLIGIALYLLSPASDFCTGQVIYVDGGYTAG